MRNVPRRPGRVAFALLWHPKGSGKPEASCEAITAQEVADFARMADSGDALGDFYMVDGTGDAPESRRPSGWWRSPYAVAAAIVLAIVVLLGR